MAGHPSLRTIGAEGCAARKLQHPEHGAYVNSDQLCRPCLQAIRIDVDAAWGGRPADAPPRDRQLLLMFYGITPGVTQSLRKYALRKGARDGEGRDRLRRLEQQRAAQGPNATIRPPDHRPRPGNSRCSPPAVTSR